MKRALSFCILALAAAACSGSTEKPGAALHGPAALAVFDGIVDHGNGAQRPYLAVASERGDELRLIDTLDDDVVTSPGLVFPLSIPTAGRPMLLAAADLGDGLPDALAVVAAGSSVVEVVNTWDGEPRVMPSLRVDLGTYAPGAEVLSMIGAAVPSASNDGTPAPDVGRILVGLASVDATGGKLAVIDFRRDSSGLAIDAPTVSVLTNLGFEPVSLAQGGHDALRVYAASREPLSAGVGGVQLIKFTAVSPGPGDKTIHALDARVPTEQVAFAHFGGWTPGTEAAFDAGEVDRVIAVPVASECGAPPARAVRCGLLAIDVDVTTDTGALAANWTLDPVDVEEDYLRPIQIPAPVSRLLATGRTATALAITSGAGTVYTTALAVVTATDGRIYFVDVARWMIASDTSPVAVAKVSTVTSVPGTGSALGLWGFGGGGTFSAAEEDLGERIRVTAGFTPDDAWTLSYQGVLPALEGRAARVSWSGSVLAVAVRIRDGEPAGAAQLTNLGVKPGDTVEITASGNACLDGAELAVTAIDLTDASLATIAAPACLASVAAFGPVSAVATFRAQSLLLSGAAFGHALRPTVFSTAPAADGEQQLPGTRLFCATDAAFAFTRGPARGLAVGVVTSAGAPAAADTLTRGTELRFTTSSGLTPSGRHPIDDGTALASSFPIGLALVDSGGANAGVRVYASFTAGLVMSLSTSDAPTKMTVIR